MQKLVLLTILLSCFNSAESQDIQRCFTQEMIDLTDEAFPGYKKAIKATLKEVSTASQFKDNDDEIYRIPVVIHILYSNDQTNIHDSVVHNQIRILNEDFRRRNEDTSLTREIFKSRAADTKIEFYLASQDPNGNYTNGITRTQSNTIFALSLFNNNVKRTDMGGIDAWPTNRYLNIWVCNLSFLGINALLGYATPPVGAPNWPDGSAPSAPEYDGVVVSQQVFGSNNPLRPANLDVVSKGRTTTHEVGHYLGLRHIWGDGGGLSGEEGCNVDDGIDDTPNAAAASQQQCNYNNNTCVDEPFDYPDMIENYMDYSDERCMNMFTQGQMNAMRYCLKNIRHELVDPNNAPVGIYENRENNRHLVKIFPNPVENNITIQNKGLKGNYILTISDLNGKACFNKSLNLNDFELITLDISFLNKGFYHINLKNNINNINYKTLKL
jgi:hypothetical protein